MSDITPAINLIQVEETEFLSATSYSILRRIGGVINYALTNGLVFPVGTIKKAFLTQEQFQDQMGTTWVLMDGRSVVGSDYATLTGNSNIPDARGMFLRMKDNGAGIDQLGDLALGSTEQDNVPYHAHAYNINYGDSVIAFEPTLAASFGSGEYQPLPPNAASVTVTLTILNAGGNDTRGKNLTINWFVKINAVSSV